MSEWIEHDGMGLPVPLGTIVVVKLNCGDIVGPYKAGMHHENDRNLRGKDQYSAWHWACPENYFGFNALSIVAYRIVNDGEEAKREARSELFKKMIEGVAPVGGEPKLPAPKKKVKVSG